MRTIVADMLLTMSENLQTTKREIKQCQHEQTLTNMKVNETNMKLEREAKIKDLVD